MVVTAIAQIGMAFHNYINLADAVRVGARVAVVSRSAASPTSTTQTAVRNAASGLSSTSLAIQVTSTWQSGADVTVSATYPYTISIFGIPVRSGSLTSSTTQRVE